MHVEMERKVTRRNLQLKALRNVLRTGHCAPTVMRTLLEETRGAMDERMVVLTSGLPAGIADLRAECGAVTSAIVALGLEYGGDAGDGEIPRVITVGRRHMERFRGLHGAINCREIRKSEWNLLPCIRAICSSPEILMDLLDKNAEGVPSDIDSETASAYSGLLKAFRDGEFHCAHSVLRELDDVIEVDEKVLRACWGFLGGTLLQGLTCGALTAGVLAIGSRLGEIEDSHIRVLKMTGRMIVGADPMREDVNRFNRAINTSHRLALWFEDQFGSTKCHDILEASFSSRKGVNKYLSENGMDRCREITRSVAQGVRRALGEHR